MYSNVNLKDVNYMAPFNTSLFPDCLALATEESLLIGRVVSCCACTRLSARLLPSGRMDAIQKLHVKSIPLGEQPRRIAHQPSSKTLLVATIRFGNSPAAEAGDGKAAAAGSGSGSGSGFGSGSGSSSSSGGSSGGNGGGEVNFLRLIDDQSFEQLARFVWMHVLGRALSSLVRSFVRCVVSNSIQLDPHENGASVASLKVGDSYHFALLTCLRVASLRAIPPSTSLLEPLMLGRTKVRLHWASLFCFDCSTRRPVCAEEPKEGRILVLRVTGSGPGAGDRKLQTVAKIATKGAVYTLAGFQGKLLAGINSKVQLYKWTPPAGAGAGSGAEAKSSGKEAKEGKEGKEGKGVAPMVLSGVGSSQQCKLTPEVPCSAHLCHVDQSLIRLCRCCPLRQCSHHGSIIVLALKTRGDFIVVGDLMKASPLRCLPVCLHPCRLLTP